MENMVRAVVVEVDGHADRRENFLSKGIFKRGFYFNAILAEFAFAPVAEPVEM